MYNTEDGSETYIYLTEQLLQYTLHLTHAVCCTKAEGSTAVKADLNSNVSRHGSACISVKCVAYNVMNDR